MDTRIREAIRAGDDATAEALLAAQPGIHAAATVFGTWMHIAASHGRLRVVELLTHAGADVNARGEITGGTPLNLAAAHGHRAVVEYLLSHGAELETREPEVNPLFSAIHGGHGEIVRLLLKRGIDASVSYTGSSMANMAAAAFALERGHQDFAHLIETHRQARTT